MTAICNIVVTPSLPSMFIQIIHSLKHTHFVADLNFKNYSLRQRKLAYVSLTATWHIFSTLHLLFM